MSYTIIGGMAVIRNGCSRTTIDIDIITTREGCQSIRNVPEVPFNTWTNHAVDKNNNIHIDIFFPGNDWEMLIPLDKEKETVAYLLMPKTEFICL